MSEYDAQSKAASPEYRDNYDRIFRQAKAERQGRAEQRSATEFRCPNCQTVYFEPGECDWCPGVERERS